jgi:hypothetical protein
MVATEVATDLIANLAKAEANLADQHEILQQQAEATGHVGPIDTIMNATDAVNKAKEAINPDAARVAKAMEQSASVHASVDAFHEAQKRAHGYVQGAPLMNGQLPDYSKRQK